MGKTVKKGSEDALNQALDKLVMISPNFSLSFLDKIESRWQSGRKKVAQAKGLKLVVTNA